MEDALPLCVCQAAGPAGRGDSEIVAVLQPTNKLQRGRGGGRREGERESVPAIIYVLFVFFLPPTLASFFEKMRTDVGGGER